MAQRAAGRWALPGFVALCAAAVILALAGPAQAELSAAGTAGTITVTSPDREGLLTSAASILIVGAVSDPQATLTLNGVGVALSAAGEFAVDFALGEGTNVVRVVASDGALGHSELFFTVTRDSLPPALELIAPLELVQLPQDRVSVLGRAEVGAVVNVNGRTAEVSPLDGTFEVRDLTLSPTQTGCLQPATVTVEARDAAGNTAQVVRQVLANQCVSHPTLSASLPPITVRPGQTDPVALDLSRYFDDDAGRELLIFSTYVTGPAASAVGVTYSTGALSLHWTDPAFEGSGQVLVTALDRDGETSDPVLVAFFVLADSPVNGSPTLLLPRAADPLPAGGAVSFTVVASDPDGEPLTVSVEPASAGAFVLLVEPLAGPGSYRVTVTADASALAAGVARFIVEAADAHFAVARGAVSLAVYDASPSPGITLESPAPAEAEVGDLVATPDGGRGLWLELGALRRVPRLAVQSPAPGAPLVEVPAGNEEQTFWRVLVPLPALAGSHTVTVWAFDPGLAARRFSFVVSLAEAPAPPALEAIALEGAPGPLTEGAELGLAWTGLVPDPSRTSFVWTVDGEVVSFASQPAGVRLDAGEHLVTVTATSPSGSSSASTTVSVGPRAAALPPGTSPLFLWLGIAGLAAAGLILGGTEVGFYFFAVAVLGALIDRANREKLLAHFVRGRIYQIIEYEPGVHLSELQRKAGVARGVCAYHLHALEKAGLVKTSRDGMFLRFFVTKVRVDRDTYALAEADREVLREIESRPGITEREVAELLGRSSGQVARSVKALAQSGYLEARHEGETVQLFARTQRGPGEPAAPAP